LTLAQFFDPYLANDDREREAKRNRSVSLLPMCLEKDVFRVNHFLRLLSCHIISRGRNPLLKDCMSLEIATQQVQYCLVTGVRSDRH